MRRDLLVVVTRDACSSCQADPARRAPTDAEAMPILPRCHALLQKQYVPISDAVM
jgi:hypothetical protein